MSTATRDASAPSRAFAALLTTPTRRGLPISSLFRSAGCERASRSAQRRTRDADYPSVRGLDGHGLAARDVLMAARVLLVEDTPTNLALMQSLLQAAGYGTLTGTDGLQGIGDR